MATTINFGNNSATMPVTAGRKKTSGSSNDTWKKVAIGGISAIAFGGAAYAATTFIKGESDSDDAASTGAEENSVDNAEVTANAEAATVQAPAPYDPSMQMATSVNDDMTFAEAFAAARAEVHAGGMFEWHGNVYGTYYGDEWDALTPDQQSAFTAGTSGVAADKVNHNEVAENKPEATSPVEETQPEDDNNEVAEVNIDHIDYDPASEVSTAYVTVDGTEVVMSDIDNDGVFDVLYVDENGNGRVEENEVYDITDENITVQGLGGYTEPSLEGYIDEDFMADNDIDIDSIEL